MWSRDGLQTHKWTQGLHDVEMGRNTIRESIDGIRGSLREEIATRTGHVSSEIGVQEGPVGAREDPCGRGMACKHTNGSRSSMMSTCVKTSPGNS